MTVSTRDVLLHTDRVLWKEHKPLKEVMELKATTIPHIWETTYQGNPTSPKGKIFKREWFKYRYADWKRPVSRIISFDTSLSDAESAAESACVIADLQADYSLRVVYAEGRHIQFPQLVEWVTELAFKYNQDKMLQWIVIEKKVSGFSLIQTLKQSTDRWISTRVFGYTPKVNKELRYNQSAVWCANGMVALPEASDDHTWLFDFEDDLFSAPDLELRDKMDAFAQMILFMANYLAQGYSARQGQ